MRFWDEKIFQRQFQKWIWLLDGTKIIISIAMVIWLKVMLLCGLTGAVWHVLSRRSALSTCPTRASSSLDLISWWTRASKFGSLRSTELQPVHSQSPSASRWCWESFFLSIAVIFYISASFPSFRKLYSELCQGIVDVAISSVFTLNSSSDSSSASSSPYSSSPSSTFTTNSCSSPKLRGPLHVGPFTRL